MSKNFMSYQDALSIFSEYAEEINKSIKKFSVMPNYMNFELGTIIQYVGDDSGDYVNGYFYERTASGWVQKNTQPTASGLGTAAFLDVAERGDAASDEVVKGDDSRLSDSRPASDVPSWAKQSTKPTYNKSEVGLANVDNTSDATKKTNFTGSIADGNTGFATGGDVYTALGNKVDKVTGKGLSTNDYTDEDKEKVNKIDVLSTSVSGNPLSFTTKSAQLANNAEIVLEPIQAGSGDPSPSNVRPISGYDEIELAVPRKNLINENDHGDGYLSGQYLIENGNTGAYSGMFVTKYTVIKASAKYTLSGIEGNDASICFYDANKNYLSGQKYAYNSSITFTTPSTSKYCRATGVIGSNTIMLEEGETVTTYEPYNPATDITLKLNETVYGGKLNVRTGELVVDRGIVDLGDLTYVYDSVNNRFWSSLIAGIISTTARTLPMAASCYKCISDNRPLSEIPNYSFYNSYESIGGYIYIHDNRYSDPSSLKTTLTGQKLVYPLATPYTIQLTPHEISLLLGDNVVTTNGTTINLDYNANGEMASLSDLSGVGESVNALGTHIEEIIEAIKDYTGYKDVLGLEVDYENKSFKRLASAVGLEAGIDFNAFRMYSGMRRCNLDADGNVTAYRGEDGYSESQNTMVEIPYFYYRMEPLKLKKETKGYSVKKARYYISENPHPGFKLFPAFEIDGRILDAIYYSAFNGSLYDTSESAYLLEDEQVMDATVDKLVSIIGAKPASGLTQNLTKANLETMAQNLGSGYHVSDIYAEMTVTWLMLIEYGVHDFQRTNLGYGVVNKSSGSGNESVKNGLATNLDETGSTFVKVTTGLVSICYRWIENPYGNIWNNVQAVNVWGDGTMQGGECFICTDGNYNESKHDDNYEGVGFYLPAADSHISAFGYGKEKFDWLLLPSEATGADNALPVGDHVWLTANLNGYRIAVLGAGWYYGLNAGRSSWSCGGGVGVHSRYIGGRLVYRKLRR